MKLLALIRARQEPAAQGAEATPPATPCAGCGAVAWFWQPGWPEPGRGDWLCRTCSSRPALSLREVAADLTAADWERLDAEAAAGDVLAQLTLVALAEPSAPPAVEAVEDTTVAVTRTLGPYGPGWAVVWSHVLGEELVFSRDAAVQVPAEHAALPRFDRDELAVLVEQRPGADRLRAIADVKREMPGSRVVRDSGEPLTPARDVFPQADTDARERDEPAQGELAALSREQEGPR